MDKNPENELLFSKSNYRWVLIGLGLTALGFILMIGGGSDNPSEFSYELFSFRRLTLAPILVLAGFAVQFYAILKKKKDKTKEK